MNQRPISAEVLAQVERRRKQRQQAALDEYARNDAVYMGVCPACAGDMRPTGTLLQRFGDIFHSRERKVCTACGLLDFYFPPGD